MLAFLIKVLLLRILIEQSKLLLWKCKVESPIQTDPFSFFKDFFYIQAHKKRRHHFYNLNINKF